MRRSRTSTQFQAVLALSLLLLIVTPAWTARAASMCMRETGQCIGEPFGDFWLGNGGLPVFGFPLLSMVPETNVDTGKTYVAQWLERERLELHPENLQPYTILLGRLGVERLSQLGRDWTTFAKAAPSTPHYQQATGHAIAPQFWDYWRSHGLDLGDVGISERESLALFGYPISEPTMERNQAGDTVLTQWYERARLEHHANNREPYRVLLGLLGQEMLPTDNPVASPRYEERTGVAQTILSYYNAVNRKEYQRAYSYWDSPGTGPASMPPDYTTFVQGYADTAYVAVTSGTPSYDAGAGNFWATVPVVLSATTTGGGIQMFAGCYVLHHTSPGADPRPDAVLWKLNRAALRVVPTTATPASYLTVPTCDSASLPPVPPSPEVRNVIATVRVADNETYRLLLTDPDDISTAHKLLLGEEAPGIPNGRVVRGDPSVNIGYTWHIDPASIEFVDVTIELCDGRPSDVENNLITSDRFCPWSAKIIAIDPL